MQAVKEITKGARVRVLTATGERVWRRALGGIAQGHTFPVVWACREEEWDAATTEGRDPLGVPWPADDVELTE